MTLVVSANTPDSIWMLADTRLSARGRRPRDDGMKVMCLVTVDGIALLGYAGLGATIAGTQPANWMSAVLRGRNMPMEQSLRVLADAVRREFPKHLRSLANDVPASHNVLAQCIVQNKPKIYTIDIGLSVDRSRVAFRHVRHVIGNTADSNARTPRFGIAGSGAAMLVGDKRWMRDLLRVLRAYDCGAIAAAQVADTFASVNYKVHLALADRTVGPRCIVVWRNRPGSSHRDGGGQLLYDGNRRHEQGSGIPIIGNGVDIHALTSLMRNNLLEQMKSMPNDQLPFIDFDKVHAGIENLPDQPDEKLR